MNNNTLLNLIKNPANISNDEAEMLEEVVKQNPYFQLGHLLIAKFQHTQKSTLATQKIRKASLYAYNRSRLKTFLDVVNSTENDNPQTFKTTSKDAKTFFENIQNEISDFDKKFAEADPEIVTKELEKSYQTDNYKLETTPALVENIKQTNNQKEQSDLIEAFLNKADTPKRVEKNLESETEVDNISENIIENITENTKKDSTENAVSQVVDTFVEIPVYEPIKETSKEEESSNVENNDESDEVTEIQAITLYASGKNKEAVEIYKKLLKINPDKKDYYESQIEILSDFSEEIRTETPSSDIRQDTNFTETRDLNIVNFDTTPAEVVEKQIITEKITEPVKETVIETFGDRKEVQREIEEVKIPEIIRIPTPEVKLTEKFSENISAKIEEKKIENPVYDTSNGQMLHEDVALKLLDEGRMDEAVEVYKKLILQNPEKKAYFVTQIEILEN